MSLSNTSKLDYEWYKPGFSGVIVKDPKLEEFLDDVAGLLLYKSYNEVYLPKPFLEKIKGKIKKIDDTGESVCVELVNGDTYCVGLGEGIEGYYSELSEDEMKSLSHEADEIVKEAQKKTLEAMKKGLDEWHGWIVSENPDGYAVYEIVITKD